MSDPGSPPKPEAGQGVPRQKKREKRQGRKPLLALRVIRLVTLKVTRGSIGGSLGLTGGESLPRNVFQAMLKEARTLAPTNREPSWIVSSWTRPVRRHGNVHAGKPRKTAGVVAVSPVKQPPSSGMYMQTYEKPMKWGGGLVSQRHWGGTTQARGTQASHHSKLLAEFYFEVSS